MVHAPFEVLWDCLIWESQRATIGLYFGLGLLLCLGASFLPGRALLAQRLFVGFQLGTIIWLFPAVSNHFFLVFFCLLLLSVLDLEREEEALIGLRAVRWAVLLVLFYSGVQKVLYGTYFKAQLLTWTIAHDVRFRTAFEPFLPTAEADRIAALADTVGPFGTEWWPLLVISNFVYLFEIVAPAFLLHPRTRSLAVGATTIFMVLLETGAREWFLRLRVREPALSLRPRKLASPVAAADRRDLRHPALSPARCLLGNIVSSASHSATRRKTLLVGLLLAAFALWPLLHYVLAQKHFVSPWRLFGWAMYCVPVYKPRVEFFVEQAGQRVPIAYPRISTDGSRSLETFVRNRAELGTLVDPDPLGRTIFEVHPGLDRVIIRITQPVYHYDSDSIRSAYFEHVIERLEP